ncbi:hypothetical protein [Sphingobacterium sp. 18053]|uniref:hypothetical protein n=1 Tax=Sphingobacterium sp. 18053 TaxID=2681401 RepID=UPI00135CF71E|nr:hypothetical protein [Sphingobacterium sp. 18053]
MVTKEELLNKLPVRWADITLKQYIQFRNLIEQLGGTDDFEKVYRNMLDIYFYVFTGVQLYDVEGFRQVDYFKVAERFNAFENDESNTTAQIDEELIKDFDQIIFEDLLKYMNLQEQNNISNWPEMINILLKEPIDNIENQMNMAEANRFFFVLENQLTDYLKALETSLMEKLKKKHKAQ